MAAKRSKNRQPADDPQLKEEVSEAVDQAQEDVSEGNLATADKPSDTVDISYQGHSHPNP